MTTPSTNQFSINFSCFFKWLVSYIFVIHVKLLCPFCSRHHMNNCLVTTISKLDCRPSSFVKDCLPDIFISVCTTIHHTPIKKNDRMFITSLCNIYENVFKVHLELHEILLGQNCLNKTHLLSCYRGTALFKQGCSFWNLKDSKTHLL